MDTSVGADTTTDVVLVGTNNGLFRSTNGGSSYAAVADTDVSGKLVWSLVKTSAGWLAATETTGTPRLGALVLSTDLGATWAPIATPLPVSTTTIGATTYNIAPGRITLGVGLPGDATVYAFAAYSVTSPATASDYGQYDLFFSTNGGASWTACQLTVPSTGASKTPSGSNTDQPDMDIMAGQAFYNHMLLVDPTVANRDTVYVAGQLSSARSTNAKAAAAGSTWTLLTNWLPRSPFASMQYAHADFHCAAFTNVGGTARLLFGNDGGLALSSDGGSTWTHAKNIGITSHLIYAMASGPLSNCSADSALAGLQDNGTHNRNFPLSPAGTGTVWDQTKGGDGFGVGWSQANNATTLATYVFNDIDRSTSNPPDDQLKWNTFTTGLPGAPGNDRDYYFVTPIVTPSGAADPTGTVFFSYSGPDGNAGSTASNKIFKSSGSGWTTIANAEPSTAITTGLTSGRYVRAESHGLGIHPTDLNRIAAAGNGGILLITTNGGTSWTERNLSAMPASGARSWQGFNASAEWVDNNTLYACSESSAANSIHVAKSTDGGATWAAAETGLPDLPVTKLLCDRGDATGNTLYAATWLGVYRTTNGGSSWSLLGTGLPQVRVADIYLHPNSAFLRAATWGRGVWQFGTTPTYTVPDISTQPVGATFTVGSPFSLTVAISNPYPAVTYQWRRGGVNLANGGAEGISGATTATLNVATPTCASSGTYDVVITNCAGSTTSLSAFMASSTLGVTISEQPANTKFVTASNFALKVVAAGTGLTYQWRKDGSSLSDGSAGGWTRAGSTTATLQISSAATVTAGNFDCVITPSSGCALTSNAAIVSTSNVVPNIVMNPSNLTVTAPASAAFTVKGGGGGANTAVTLNFQWRKNGVNLTNASPTTWTNASIVVNNNVATTQKDATSVLTINPTVVGDAGNYDCVVSITGVGSATSGIGILTVNAGNAAPTISNVADQTINEDANTGALAITVGDAETPVASLTMSGSSSNTTLVPNANIVFGGSGASRTVTVTPAANQFGTSTITLTVTDGNGGTATDTFLLTVTSVNDNPTISNIADQTINEDANTGALAFTIGDVETAAASLTMSGSSSNTTLVPNANIVFGGSGASRTVTVTPAANQFGTATITVTVTDANSGTGTDTFLLTVTSVNDNPTISDITDQTINEDANTGALAFTVGDTETAAASLTVSGSSSNTTLVPNANIVFGGSGASRTVTVTPAANQFGTATITVTVTDANGGTGTDTFLLTVTSVNDNPTISDITNQTINEDANTGALAFTIGDVETAAASLTLGGSSSNTTLVPNANIVFGGSGASRTVTVTPAANQFGTATITVTVTDANGGTGTDTFLLTVTSVNDNPTISDITDQTINEDANTGALAFTIGDVETAAASLTVSGSSSNTTLVPNANIVFGGSGASRTVTVTPAANQFGTATITVTVTDANGGTGTDTFLLTVTSVNDNPTITDITDQTISEDANTGALAFTIGDVETAAASLTVSGSSSNTTLVPNANIVFGGSGTSRTVTVTPAANQFGTATITVTVTDANGGTGTDTFLLTVNSVNDNPTITDITDQTINEDANTGALAFTIGDVETAAASLTVSGSSSNTTLVPNANIVFGGSGASRTVTITPAANQFGTATITVTVTDANGGTGTDTFLLTVTSVNDNPTISDVTDQSIALNSNTGALAFTIGDVETAAALLTMSGSSSNTTLVPNANIVFGGSGASRTVTVAPAAGQSGTATITLTVTDANSGTGVDTFVLTVNANTNPTISDITNQTINEDANTGALAFTVGDSETPAASLTLGGSSSNTTLVPNANIVFGGSGASRTVTVTPAANQFGTATITVTVTDANGGTGTDTFLLTVTSVNDNPTISDVTDQSVALNTSTGALAFTIGDVETAAASLTMSGSSSNTTLVPNANIVFGGSGASRTVTVTPAAGQSGTATITLTVTDANSGTGVDTFVLTVNANTNPTISDITNQTINEDANTGALAFTVGDSETPAASLTLGGSSSNTTLVPNANIVFGGSGASRTVTVTPAANQFGTATITVTVTDANGGTGTDTFLLTVTSVNDNPTISDVTDQSVALNTSTGALAFTIGDVETAAASLTMSGSSSNTTLVPNANIVFGGSGASRTVTVTPAAGQSGTATITLTVTDANSGTGVDTFVLTVNANTNPTISDITNQTINEDANTGALAFTIGDVETATASLTMSGSSSNTTLVPNANIVFGGSGASRTVTVTPAANQFGTATITVTVTDANGGTGTDTFLLTVTSINDNPTISDVTDQSIALNSNTGALAFTIGDVETAAASLTMSGSSSNTTLVPNANIVFGGSGASRTVTVTPAAGQSGTATITLTVTDANSGTGVDTFVLTVNANTNPTISDITNQTINEDANTGALAFTVGDAETPAASLTLGGSSSNTTLVPNANIVFGGSGASRTVTVTPAANQFGTSTITVTVTDANGGTGTDTFLLTVTSVNDNPTISDVTDQSIALNSNTGALAFTIGDVETAAASLTMSGSSSNTTLVPNANIIFGGSGASRTVTVTPAAGQSGTATITLTVTDANSGTGVDTFVLTVNANTNPTISDITNQTINEDANTGALAFTVGDAETPAASLTLGGSSSNTTLVPNANIVFGGSGASRTVTVTPAANQFGTSTITITVTDANGGTGTDTFLLTVTSINDNPTISDVTDQSIALNSNTGALAFTIGDVETAAASLTMSGSSSNTTLVPNANIVFGGSGASRTVTVTPAAGQSGTATITLTVTDANSGTGVDTFVLTVNANTNPTISDITNQTINEDANTGALAFTVGDAETPAASLTVSGSSSNTTLVPNANIVFGGSGASRTVTVTPAANQFGTATITVTVTDANGGTGTDTFLLTVTSVNDNPTISDVTDQSIALNSNTGALAFTIGDVETAAASLTMSGSSSNTTLVPNANIVFGGSGASRTVTVTPAAGQSGTATITLTVTDANSGTGVDTFVLTVNANTNPTISDITNQTINEDANTGALAFTVGDSETPAASLTLGGSSSNTTLVPNANIVFGGSGASRTVTVTPAANQFGTATITVTVTDANSGTGTDTFLLTVTSVNDNPTISDVTDQSIALNSNTGALAFTIGDVETAAASLTMSGSSSNTTLVPNANIVFGGSGASRTVTVTPAAGQSGTATITLTVTDANSGTGTDTFVLTVNPGAPASVVVSAGSGQSTTVTTTFGTALQALVRDAGNTPLPGVTVTFTAPAVNATGTFAATGTTSQTATTDASGIATASAFTANATAGSYTVAATVSGVGSPANFSLTNLPGPVTNFAVTGYPDPTTAGVSHAFTVTAQDNQGNTVPTYGGTVHFTSTDGAATLPVDSTLVSGTGTFFATLRTVGLQDLKVADSLAPAVQGGQFNIQVDPAAAATVSATAGTPQSATIGTPFATALQATVKDAFNNPVAGATVTFTAPAAGASGVFTLTGTDTQTATTNAAGVATASTFTANGTTGGYSVTASVPGASSGTFSLTNTAGLPASIAISAGSGQSAAVNTAFGTALKALVRDAGNNPVAGVTVTFTAPGAGVSGAFSGGNTAVTNASGIATANAFTANTTTGTYTVAATVAGVGSPANFSLTNTPGAAATFTVAGHPSPVTAGTTNGFTVTARDAFGNTATGYAGTVHFTSTDGAATLPADSLLVGGTGAFTATLRTAGSRTLTATDTVSGGLTGSQAGIVVNPAAAASLVVAGFPSPTPAGATAGFTVRALDAYGNTATGFLGTVSFSSSDGAAVLPANYAFTGGDAGLHAFTATLNTTGLQSLSAASAGLASGSQVGILVQSPSSVSITSFTPSSGPVGTTVIITGTGFTGATQVKFNGTVCLTYTVMSATQINAVVPAGATTGLISITAPGGTGFSGAAFTVSSAAPRITSFSPTSGKVGAVVTITGSNIGSATAVTFNGTACLTFIVVSPTQIKATVPAGATTGPIAVVTPSGTATTGTVKFFVLP
ncbi:MAG: tandem-95 repeat protein [Holophagaceae bacterium]|nr:tandem-95 repeat protein [Holophagaceae bacterium]